VNFLGVGFPHASLPLQNPPDIEDLPIPANWHTDLAELGGALHVVSECSREFTMIELGSGIGIWSNICGKAAKMRGLKTRVIGIEGDKKHLMVAADTLKVNKFLPDEYQLIHGIVAHDSGRALFKKHLNSGIDWGRQPILTGQAELFAKALLSGDYEEVPVYSLNLLLNEISNVDLLHVDIQGGEETLFDGQEVLLNDKIKNIIIGTHSRKIEGKLFDYFQHLGWSLEAERPLIGSIENEGLRTVVDGVQYWKNKKSN
jgi:FkbM family methyltransferase